MAWIRAIAFATLVGAMWAGAPTLVVAQAAPMVSGLVVKVDPSAKKITIRHGPIKSLNMNEKEMTMVFAVQDAAMLADVKPGYKIDFTAERGNGITTVTTIRKSPTPDRARQTGLDSL